MTDELIQYEQAARELARPMTPAEHQVLDDKLSVVQDILKRLGADKRTQDKYGAIRVWNLRKLRRVLDADPNYRPGPKPETLTTGKEFNSSSKTAQLANELGRWPLDDWLAWRAEMMNGGEKVLTAHGAYKQAKNERLRSEREQRESAPEWSHPEVLLFNAPFQEVLPTLELVDMVFTDPPYARQYLSLYDDLNDLAAPLLPEGGSLITYFGHYAAPYVMNALSDLRFWWMLCSYQPGKRRRLDGVDVYAHWKPLAWFVKDGRATPELVDDLVTVDNAPKQERHDWEQGTELASYYIEHLTEPGDWVLDPMMGSGTTGVAAIQLGRCFIGIEKDEKAYADAQQRIGEALARRD